MDRKGRHIGRKSARICFSVHHGPENISENLASITDNTVSSVPEPQVYLTLLAGSALLMLVATMLRRLPANPIS